MLHTRLLMIMLAMCLISMYTHKVDLKGSVWFLLLFHFSLMGTLHIYETTCHHQLPKCL